MGEEEYSRKVVYRNEASESGSGAEGDDVSADETDKSKEARDSSRA